MKRAAVKAPRQQPSLPLTVILYAGLVLLPGTITASSTFAGASSGQKKIILILLAIFCTLVVSSWNVYKEIQTKKTANSVKVTAQLLSRTGGPLVSLLGNIASQDSLEARRSDTNTLAVRILGIAQSECGRHGARGGTPRSTFYRFTSPTHLERYRIWDGRQGPAPRLDFDATRDKNDRGVIEIANGEDYLLVEDVDNAPPDFYRDYTGREYSSFLMVPIRAGGHSYGFLSVDSDRSFSLTKIDVGYVTLMAALLGAAMALLDDKYPQLDPVPETK
jgi:GAF domain